ncbi:MAG: LysM peptidoglycan-binding domain-containing protein [Mangrovibacterium sp.]
MLKKYLFLAGAFFVGIHFGFASPGNGFLDRQAGLRVETVALPQTGQPQYLTYKVKKGNTLHFIAKQYGVTVDYILKWNPQARNGLKKGQVLRIPNKDYRPETKAAVDSTVEKPGTHTVQASETLYSLARRYHCEVADLIRLNPDAANGLRTGMVLKVPVTAGAEVPLQTNDDTTSTQHIVQKGETIFGLAKQYGLSISDLKQANPSLATRGLVEGESIVIPKPAKGAATAVYQMGVKDTSAVDYRNHAIPIDGPEIISNCQPDPTARLQTYHVALLLPLYLTANDTINQQYYNPEISGELPPDSAGVKSVRKIYPRSESFVQFYEGVLLAVDSLKQAGMRLKLHVYDTNQSAVAVQSILRKPELRNMNLLIGPVFTELQGPVAEFARTNHIPMVSPLSATGSFELNNPYYYKVNPGKDYLIQQTASYVAEQYPDNQLFVLKMGDYKSTEYAQLVATIREKRSLSPNQALFREYNLPAEGLSGLKSLLSKEQTNVFIIPSETEAQVSVAVTNLNRLSEDYPIALVGLASFQRFKSIQTEYYHRTHLSVLNPYYIDYQEAGVNHFVRKFRRNFLAEPNQFSFQGYDIALYFMSALYSHGNNFASCLPTHRAALTQGEFYFEKASPEGGYMNRGLFMLEYEPDYSIQMRGVRGVPANNVVE